MVDPPNAARQSGYLLVLFGIFGVAIVVGSTLLLALFNTFHLLQVYSGTYDALYISSYRSEKETSEWLARSREILALANRDSQRRGYLAMLVAPDFYEKIQQVEQNFRLLNQSYGEVLTELEEGFSTTPTWDRYWHNIMFTRFTQDEVATPEIVLQRAGRLKSSNTASDFPPYLEHFYTLQQEGAHFLQQLQEIKSQLKSQWRLLLIPLGGWLPWELNSES